jgi:hypothetical protein
MLAIGLPPVSPGPTTSGSPDWVVLGVIACLLIAFAVYGFFALRMRRHTATTHRIERPNELHKAA